jgi:hypothetical protein
VIHRSRNHFQPGLQWWNNWHWYDPLVHINYGGQLCRLFLGYSGYHDNCFKIITAMRASETPGSHIICFRETVPVLDETCGEGTRNFNLVIRLTIHTLSKLDYPYPFKARLEG